MDSNSLHAFASPATRISGTFQLRRSLPFARSEDRTKALDSGFEMHLAKPVDPGELVSSIATLVRRRSSGR
jgi:hypothetical protein